ncbi:MAG TPA: prolyl oligopeptidase family serine peptidase [Pirellulales bacterium]|nr:prolyl oligopeptidase family serine peptidase [Pirellulales bacterium]
MRMNITRVAVLLVLAHCAPRQAARADEPADPNRPAAITTSGVPAVPQALTDRLTQYQNTRSAAFLGWSEQAGDAGGILISTRFGNSVQLHRVYTPGGRREQITFFDEPCTGRFIPQAKDGAILLSMSKGGNENEQVYLLDRATFKTSLLTDGKSRNLLGPLEHSGARMIVNSNRRNGRDTDVYIADTRKPDSMQMLLETSGEYWVATDWSLDGTRLLMNRYVSANESYPAIFDVAKKEMKPLPIPAEGKVSFGTLAFAKDGRSAYVTCDAKGEFLQLARLDLTTLDYQWLTEDIAWDVADVVVDPATGAVAFTINEDGASRLFLLDDKGRRELKLPLGIVTGLEFSPDGAALGLTLARPDAPADAYTCKLGDGALTRWTYSEVGGLDPASFVAPERIQFATFDGRQIPAYVFKPRTATPEHRAAVLINIHGGPEGQYRPLFSGVTQYQVNEMGLAVIYPNVRGSAGYGKTYLQLDNAELREDSVRDIGALLDWVKTRPELDASRVAVTGGSYGGYMVLASLVNFPERIKAGIDIVGISNFITFLQNTSPYRQDLRRAEYGDERKPEMRSVFERINPAGRVDKIQSALLVVHGVNDPRVPFSEAQQIADRVRAAGRAVWTVYADNEGHGFAKKDNRDYLTAVEALFLGENLQ